MDLIEMIGNINKEIREGNPIQRSGVDEIFYDFKSFVQKCKFEIVQKGDINEHRWYGLQDVVYNLTYLDDSIYVQNTVITQVYSEQSSFEDIYHNYKEFLIVHPKEVTTIIYE